MLNPRYANRSSSLAASAIVSRRLPTGKGFGGSMLKIIQLEVLVFPVVSSVESQLPTHTQHPSSLVVEFGKIVLLSLWLWLAISANFCVDCVNSIMSLPSQDI